MMKFTEKSSVINAVAAVFCLVLFAVAADATFASEKKAPSALCIIKNTKGDVVFSHEKHKDAEGGCASCHGMYAEKAGVVEEMKKTGKMKSKAVMISCRECHGSLMADDKKTGPTADCSGCHK